MNKKLKVMTARLKKKGKNLNLKDKDRLLALPAAEMQQVVSSLPASSQQSILELLEKPSKPAIAPLWLDDTKATLRKYPILADCGSVAVQEKVSPIHHVVESVMIAAGDCIPSSPDAVTVLMNHVQSVFKHVNVSKVADLQKKFPNAVKRFCQLRKKIAGKKEEGKEEEEEDLVLDTEDQDELTQTEQERLEFNDMRTRDMTAAEYQIFTNSRRANFLSLGRRQFLSWVGKEYLTSTGLIDLLSYVVWDYAYRVVETALRSVNGGQLLPIRTPLTVAAVEEACRLLS